MLTQQSCSIWAATETKDCQVLPVENEIHRFGEIQMLHSDKTIIVVDQVSKNLSQNAWIMHSIIRILEG